MAIGAAMSDKALILRKVQVGTVDGAPRYDEQEYGNPFRCRYEPGNETENRSDSQVTRRIPATLLIALRDTKGQPVDVKATDRVRITSRRHGVIEAEIQGKPKKITKKVSAIAMTTNLTKVVRGDSA